MLIAVINAISDVSSLASCTSFSLSGYPVTYMGIKTAKLKTVSQAKNFAESLKNTI